MRHPSTTAPPQRLYKQLSQCIIELTYFSARTTTLAASGFPRTSWQPTHSNRLSTASRARWFRPAASRKPRPRCCCRRRPRPRLPSSTSSSRHEKITTPEIARFAADTFGYPLLDLAAFDEAHILTNAVDRKLIASHRVVPLHKRGNRLSIAIADPTNLRALDEIRFQTGMAVDPIIVDDSKLAPLVARYSESAGETLKTLTNEDINLEFTDEEAAEKIDEASALEVDDAPVVKFIQKMMLDAINEGASDIHFEPYEKRYRIRFRTDGILREIASPPLVIKEKIASRIKVISRLNIAEKRVPQDGRMRLVLSKSRAVDFRVSTLPTMYGEKIVLRILDPSTATMGIEALGYDPDQLVLLLNAIQRPYGMVLVTGPTGSGKTVSLYSCLNILNKPGINISTAEDPAEIPLPGINQVNVDDRQGLTFPVALKAFLVRTRTSSWSAKSATWKPPRSRSRRRRPGTWCCRPCTPTMRPRH